MIGSRKTRPPVGGDVTKKVKPGVVINKDLTSKRQGESLQDQTQKRRAAFGDITNSFADKQNIKDALKKSRIPTQKTGLQAVVKPNKENKPKKKVKSGIPRVPSADHIVDECVISLSQGSLISSQETSSSSSSSQESLVSRNESVEDLLVSLDEKQDGVPEGVDDVDAENQHDIVQVALYAKGIFSYYKERELLFHVEPYLPKRKLITSSMRAILVDWLVEVQENFELNHETLYLAVKLVDMYVTHKDIAKEILQLVGAAALFIAAKFDERCPPLVEDFLFICDDAYKRREFLGMERSILRTVGFDIGMPLSYRFLRRYAKCCRATMETLTLARYILEMSLMEYDFISKRESEMAAASLSLALRMKQAGEWTKTLEYYTGYVEAELTPIVKKLNTYITSPPKQLTTIKSKYSHKVFYEVAKTPTLTEEDFV